MTQHFCAYIYDEFLFYLFVCSGCNKINSLTSFAMFDLLGPSLALNLGIQSAKGYSNYLGYPVLVKPSGVNPYYPLGETLDRA